MIDAGPPRQAGRFREALARISVSPADISLLIVTHGHWDHIAGAAGIKQATGCQLAAHRREADCLEQALKRLPSPFGCWGSILTVPMRLATPFITLSKVAVDIALGDTDFSLAPFGVGGRVLHTPGHSPGSVSVLLDNGDAIVGDLAMNRLPLRIGPGMPPVGDSPATIHRSWRKLLDAGARTIYPAHGKPFPADALQRALNNGS